MDHAQEILLSDLRYLIANLGHDGGQIGPSVYDTARVVSLAPPPEGAWPALDWIVEQQRPDGGWGEPSAPRSRDLPTMAALLALDTYARRQHTRDAVRRGMAFMARQASHWAQPLGDDIAIGLEILLPPLVAEGERRGMPISGAPYAALRKMGERRRALIAQRRPGPGTTPLHSWEGWGEEPDPELLDPFGSMGHNPAATAAWIHRAEGRPELAAAREAARAYLERASRVTGVDRPGVVPTCWPLPRFEQVFVLQALHLSGLLTHPALADVVGSQLDALEAAFRTTGVGFSDHFTPDGDDTAAATAVLYATGRRVDPQALMGFVSDDHFCAYRHELHPSVSVTAHAIRTLRLLGESTAPYERFVADQQLLDGRWAGDKWNQSWLYITWRAMAALSSVGQHEPARRAIRAILCHQHGDGGWGTVAPNTEETAYAVLALRSVGAELGGYEGLDEALARGDSWLRTHYRPFVASAVNCWLGKEPYRPTRIARAIELCAMLSGLPAEDQLERLDVRSRATKVGVTA